MRRYHFFVFTGKRILFLFSLIVVIAAALVIFIHFRNSNRAANPFKYIPFESENYAGKLAIIIDDFGQNRRGVNEMMSIRKHLTFAVMPFLTYSKQDAETAHENGYEVIVYLPLEANAGKISWVGPRPILTTLSDEEIKQIVADSFESVPFAAGANYHMGSKAGENQRVISDILDIIKIRHMYFVDSRACRNPIAKEIADTKGVLCYDRSIFLDGKKSKDYIKEQLQKAADIAVKKGKAIAIGHVGTEGGQATAEAIEEMLPEFEKMKIKLVYVSELGDL